MNSNLGIIEGFYGRPWGFDKRKAMIPFMQEYGLSFYIYAPKADQFLRERWQDPVPAELLAKLKGFGAELKSKGLKWGVGLSPYDLHQDFNPSAQKALREKLNQLHGLEIDWLAILFDDMRGDFPDLALRQVEICQFIKRNSEFERLIMCPSYYCFDPVLEDVFGAMPENYLQDLGKLLDPDIDIFWTGEKVCSEQYSMQHLQQVEGILGRKPFIWDNYPVNDGARMSPFLHLSKTTGREYCTPEWIAGSAINPMNEAYLSQIPMAAMLARPKDSSEALEVFQSLCERFLGDAAAKELVKDREYFEEQGLGVLDENLKNQLIEKYTRLKTDSNASCILELVEYLKGKFFYDLKDEVPTQALWET